MDPLADIPWGTVITVATTVGGYLLAFGLIARVVDQRKEAGATLAWILTIAFLPYLGALLYLLIGRKRFQRKTRKRTRTLDEFCESRAIAAVHFIKIDVEGAEMKILRGASRLLSSPGAPRVVMVEMVEDYLARFGDNKRDAVAFMSDLGYKPFVVRGGQLQAVAVETIDTENVYFQKA